MSIAYRPMGATASARVRLARASHIALRRAGVPRPQSPFQSRTSADFLRGLVHPAVATWIAVTARRQGAGLVETGVAIGALKPEAVVAHLARLLGARLAAPDERIFSPVASGDWRLVLRRRSLVIDRNGQRALLVAVDDRRIERLLRQPLRSDIAERLILVTSSHFDRLIRHWAREPWGDAAVNALRREHPAASASCEKCLKRSGIAIVAGVAIVTAMLAFGDTTSFVSGLCLALLFALWSAIRLVVTLMPAQPPPSLHHGNDAELPTYSVLLALYKEAAVVPQLLEAMRALDYPEARLEIIAVVEEDDAATQAALRRHDLSGRLTILPVPDVGPRTKPKALVAALAFARGELIVVYDAEDRPHPQQLREAAAAFRKGGQRLGCVQAPLMIAMRRWSWLSRLFAAEYAGLFRLMLPALAHWGWPIPLGGTSNHFRRQALNSSGGWDPFNVTEDADLGLRLARQGWRVQTITLPTIESCPDRLKDWIAQRARWYKGWLQTLVVHLGDPAALIAEAGLKGSATLALLIAASVASSLFFLPCTLVVLAQLLMGNGEHMALMTLCCGGFGLASAMIHGAIGLWRERRLSFAPMLIFTLFYWGLQSYAAWVAVHDLIRRPFHWRKTPHRAGE